MKSIYAEISKKQLGNKNKKNSLWFDVPYGVELSRKEGSRACFFECVDEESFNDVIKILEDNNINWQEN